MRILVTATPGHGHLLPVLPVARAARDRGHDVLVGSGAAMLPLIERSGLRAETIGPPTLPAAFAEIPGLADLAGPRRALRIYREGFAGIIAPAMADAVLELATGWRPDVIVHEDMEMGSWIAAEQLGIPHVVIQAAAWRPSKRNAAVDVQNELRVRHGLPPDPDLAGRDGALYFTTRPAALRDPALPPPPNLRELRPEPDDRVGTAIAVPPDWLAREPGRPRVAVTLGTANAHRVDLVRAIVAGLAELDVDVVVALGADPATVGAVPANVRVEPYVAMSELLPRSALVVHHGGSGTMLAALAAGRPMVIVPIQADQPDNAGLCVAAGVALTLESVDLEPAAVGAAATRLLDGPDFADRARAVAAEIASMPDADAAVDDIEALLADHRPNS